MTNGLELTQRGLVLWNQIHPGESLYLQCQRVSWYLQWAYQGNEKIVTYGTALKAARASTMFAYDLNNAAIRAGDEMFWDVGTDGHVVTVIGRDSAGRVLVANSAKSGDNFQDLGNHIYVCHADTLPWKFLGASRANGTNAPKSGIIDWPVATLAGNQRRVAASIPANGRAGASTATAVVTQVAGLDYGTFDGWVNGQAVNGNTVWFRGAFSGAYFWSGSFTDVGTHDLADLNKKVTIPAGEVGEPIVELPPARDPDLSQPLALDFPAWIQFDVKRNTNDNRAAINAEARGYYASKGQTDDYFPVKEVAHWWGSPEAGYSHDGVVNTLTGKKDYSAHFVVSAGRITEVQPLNFVAYTTGSASMHSWSTENDPQLTDLGYLTLGYLTYIVELLNPRLRLQAIELHKNQINVSTGAKFQTACSSVDTARVRVIVEAFFSGALDPKTGQAPVKEPVDPTVPEEPNVPVDPLPSTPPTAPVLSTAKLSVLWSTVAAALIAIGAALFQAFN